MSSGEHEFFTLSEVCFCFMKYGQMSSTAMTFSLIKYEIRRIKEKGTSSWGSILKSETSKLYNIVAILKPNSWAIVSAFCCLFDVEFWSNKCMNTFALLSSSSKLTFEQPRGYETTHLASLCSNASNMISRTLFGSRLKYPQSYLIFATKLASPSSSMPSKFGYTNWTTSLE